MEAFAQFASDLDQATKNQLLRGEKLTEVLKQPQYNPLSVAEQVSILFAANEGLLDDVPNTDIGRFKKEWFMHLNANLKPLSDNLNNGSALSDDDKKTAVIVASVVSMLIVLPKSIDAITESSKNEML